MINHILPVLTALVIPLVCGCESLDVMSFVGEPEIPSATDVNPVREIICMWEPAEGIGLDGKPSRGFAGQILFFTAAHPRPVQTDGDVRILLYDEAGLTAEEPRPFKQYEFSSEVFGAFLRDTNLGAAHHVFIPDPRSGNAYEECALRVVLTSKSGLPVYSKTAVVALPGPKNPEDSGVSTSAAELSATTQTTDGPTALPAPRDQLPLEISMEQTQQRSGHARIAKLRRAADQLRNELQPQRASQPEVPFDMDEEPVEDTPTRRFRLSNSAAEMSNDELSSFAGETR